MIKDRIIDFRRVKASEILRNPKNWRTHPESQRDAMKGVLAEIGIADALIARETEDGLMLIDGHLRTDLDDDTEWPVLILDVNEQEADTILATLDPLAAMAGVSKKFLAELITDLEVSDDNLQTMLNNLGKDLDLFPPPEIVEDDVPEPPKNPITKPGDLWILGNHRLLCGDSTKSGDVERLMGGETPFLMVTDPPYGVDYDPDWRNRADRANGKPYGGRSIGLVTNDTQADWTESYKLFSGDVAYIWHPPGAIQGVFLQSLINTGFEIRMTIIWAKNHFPIGRGHYHVKHEPCFYSVRKGSTANWVGDRKQTTLWEIDKPYKTETEHSTQKPVECMARPIKNHGGDVYDPFLGSGTTLIAAEQLNRQCYGIEISPQYCDVIIERWEKFSGGKAILQGSNGAPSKRKVRKKAKKKTAKAKS